MRPTVIVVPTPGPFGMMGLWMARRLNVPLVSGFHTHYEAIAEIYWRRGFGRISQGYLNWCNRLLFEHSALVLANSPEMVAQAEAIGARRTALMGTCIGSSFIASERVPLAQEGVRRVLFAGRLAAEKNLHKVLECAERLPQLRFTIAGDGPMRGDVERAARSLGNLDYVGWVARDTLSTLIDEHDVMLLLSHVESFGTVALEAMSRGRAVVVSQRCGITQWPMLADGLIVADPTHHPADALRAWFALPYAEREHVDRSGRLPHHVNSIARRSSNGQAGSPILAVQANEPWVSRRRKPVVWASIHDVMPETLTHVSDILARDRSTGQIAARLAGGAGARLVGCRYSSASTVVECRS